MIRTSDASRPGFPLWRLALIPILLAALFASLQLDEFAFNRDEPDTMLAAGIHDRSPRSLPETWSHIVTIDYSQTPGWAILVNGWSRLVGWSEPAIRSLSWLAGLLTIACLYRTGRELFSPPVGLVGALLMSGSLFFLSYMAIARAFTLIALFTTMILWSYWRLTLDRRPSGPLVLAVLFLASTALFYSHFFAALILPPLFLFHVLFAWRDRRWWQVLASFATSGAVALLQAPVFLAGLSISVGSEALARAALPASRVPDFFLYFYSNFFVRLPWPAGVALLVILFHALLRATRDRRRETRLVDAGWLPAFVACATFLLMVAANAVVRVMTGSRLRYMMPLLPLLALLAGKVLCRYRKKRASVVFILLTIWLVTGPALLLSGPEYLIDRRPSTFHHVQRYLKGQAAAGDLVVLENSLKTSHVLYLHPDYIPDSNQPWETVYWTKTGPLESVAPVHSPYHNIWLVYPADLSDVAFPPENAPGRLLCERLENLAGHTLERYARSASGCEPVPVLLDFDQNIQLTGAETTLVEDLLRVEAGLLSADDFLLSHYSLALHVIDPRTGERVAQGDVGVGPGSFVPVRSDVDLSALPAGDYELQVALYDWQSGERLMARDLNTGLVSDMHVLQRFHVE